MRKDSKDEKGDGLAFHNAIKVSKKQIDDVLSALNISNGKLYKLFKEEIFDKEEKAAAAKALGMPVEQIFGKKESPQPEQDEEYTNLVNNGTKVAADTSHQQSDQAMENKILEILDRVTRTADKWADKALIDAQNQAEMINLLRRSKETVDQ